MPDMEALESLGIDIEEGLAYCAEDPEFFGEMLGEFVREASQRETELERARVACDWETYRIQAHSIKSTSRMVGARAVSQRAEALEVAARAADAAGIATSHADFIGAYRDLVDGIRKVLP